MRLNMVHLLKKVCFLIAFHALPIAGMAQSFEIFAPLYQQGQYQMFARLQIDFENGECSITEDYGDQMEKTHSGIGFCPTGELYSLGLWNSPSAGILYIFDPDLGEFEYVTDAFYQHYQNTNIRLSAIACVDGIIYSYEHPNLWKFSLTTEELTVVGNLTQFYQHGTDLGVLSNEMIFTTNSQAPSYLQGIYEFDALNLSNSERIFPYPQSNWAEFSSQTVGGTPICNTVFAIRQHPLFGDNKGAIYNVDNHSYSLVCDMPQYQIHKRTSSAEHSSIEDCLAIIDLDVVNVSGAGGYDYLHDEIYTCLTEDGLPIAAEKIFIATDETIQEMNVEILSPLVGNPL
ncbi:MAG: hypothetical protein EA409_08480 [Saprospirales bacterium]|nr:MAG: hypothetical protein EA409_08480 [Saprospirales bacterium]